MPNMILDRIPLPNLKIYTSVSVLLVSVSIYYAIQMTQDPYWRALNNVTSQVVEIKDHHGDMLARLAAEGDAAHLESRAIEALARQSSEFMASGKVDANGNDTRNFIDHVNDVMQFITQEPICIWTLINMAYCCLILLGKSVQKVVFGELRISEQQHLKDKFWNFIFYKFIFVFGVVNVQFLHEVVLWVSWFSILGFLHLLSQLCKDRFEYLSFSPTTPGWSHFRLVSLLSAIFTTSGFMFIVCIGVGFFGGFNTFAFMAAECVLLSIRTVHVLIRYGMFLYDMRQGGMASEAIPVISWDKRGPFAYYFELGFDVAALAIDLLHHLHMLLWSNIFLSMASLVIIMQLRYLFHEIKRKIKKHRNYLWVLNHMEKSYPLATAEDLSQNSDNCAICWEKMETARKLPCGHLFHNSCLQSWLEQDTSCPTCRLGLSVQNTTTHPHPTINHIDEPENAGRANNHFFHFNGSRYVSWLPNFSVEVTHINNMLRPELATVTHTSQLRNMAREVQQMFPRYPISIIIADLQVSRSMEITIENILEGRLPVPARFQMNDEDEFGDGQREIASTSEGAGGVQSASDYYVSPDISTTSGISALESGYETERNSNIFGNQNELLRDESSDEISLGDRFSKSSTEREKILQRRKELLLADARKRYMDRNKEDLNQPSLNNRLKNKSSMHELTN